MVKLRLGTTIRNSIFWSYQKATEWTAKTGLINKKRIMHELPGITIFGSRVRRFANNFYEWRSHEWKSLANRLTSDPKIAIHGNECIILFLIRYLMWWKQSSIADFAIVAKDSLFWFSIVTWPQLIGDVKRMYDTGIVTSYSSNVLARANWRKGNLH